MRKLSDLLALRFVPSVLFGHRVSVEAGCYNHCCWLILSLLLAVQVVVCAECITVVPAAVFAAVVSAAKLLISSAPRLTGSPPLPVTQNKSSSRRTGVGSFNVSILQCYFPFAAREPRRRCAKRQQQLSRKPCHGVGNRAP